jgi:hypothetical protein
MEPQRRCAHCRGLFRPSARRKDQSYCGTKSCQGARRRQWQRQKMATDADYRETKKLSDQQWRREHRDYWRRYRRRHPAYCHRNRLLQQGRDARRRRRRDLAKKDVLEAIESIKPGTYYLVPPGPNPLAKKDVFGKEVLIIPTGYARLAPILQRRT